MKNGSMTFLALVISVVAAVLVSAISTVRRSTAESTPRDKASFVGSDQCGGCHAQEHKDWLLSQHSVAMQHATDESVLGDFAGATFAKDGVLSRFFKRGGKFWVRTDGSDGTLADFEVRYTFGVYPLQQYLIELKGGRLQALGIAWDARRREQGGQRWFDLHPGRNIKAGDPMHWTGIDQNWNYQCAYCHSTDLEKNYDRATGTFLTTWSEISVGCEACHGPASRHLSWATKSPGWDQTEAKGFSRRFDERENVSWLLSGDGQVARSTPRATQKEIETCAVCHSHRQQFSSHLEGAGRLLDAFRPSTLQAPPYYADGQQREEVYTYGSFLQSRMHASGVTCSDCHHPHTQKLRQQGNAVCGQCHAAERFDSPTHHGHAANSEGAQCAACHMPASAYMEIDMRHDHSLRIPRPDRTIALGTPNACTQCHTDKPPAWARDAIAGWYPSPKAGAQDFAEAFDLGDRLAPGAQAALASIATANASPAIVRASAIERLARFPSPRSLDVAKRALQDNDPSVRSAAIAVAAEADVRTRRELLVPLLRDPVRVVRTDAARALAGEAEKDLQDADRKNMDQALKEYVEAQIFNAERPEARANLGALHRDRGRLEEAAEAFRAALLIDPTFIPARVSLAEILGQKGDEAAGETMLREALAKFPSSGALMHAIGLSLIRQKRSAEALDFLGKAAVAEPGDPRFRYVWAVGLHDTGQRERALSVLKEGRALHPYDRSLLWVQISYEMEAGNLPAATEAAQLLRQLEPADPNVQRLTDGLLRRGQ